MHALVHGPGVLVPIAGDTYEHTSLEVVARGLRVFGSGAASAGRTLYTRLRVNRTFRNMTGVVPVTIGVHTYACKQQGMHCMYQLTSHNAVQRDMRDHAQLMAKTHGLGLESVAIFPIYMFHSHRIRVS